MNQQGVIDMGRQRMQAFRSRSERAARARGDAAELPAAIEAERHTIATADAGTLCYYADRSAKGRPLVLLHGINVAASSYEMKTLFEAFRGTRPVFALDLPGFGLSQRAGLHLSADTYIHAIEHLLRDVCNEREADRADVVALSLSSEFAAKVATDLPELVHSLVLLSPTGFSVERETARGERAARAGKASRAWKVIRKLGGKFAFDALASKPSLRFYLRKFFAGSVDEGLVRYAHQTSHQPDAHVAPLAFLAGELFPAGDPFDTYGRVRVPTLVLYDSDPCTTFGALRPFLEDHDNFNALRIPETHGLPHIEAPDRTEGAIRAFWNRCDVEQK